MTHDELRRVFLEYFGERGHKHVPSASPTPASRAQPVTVSSPSRTASGSKCGVYPLSEPSGVSSTSARSAAA